jgi:hypothetical protein
MADITPTLVVTDRLLKGSEPQTIERTLMYGGEALAAVYVEFKTTDYTVAWPVITGVDLASLFDAYDEFVRDAETSVEWWIGDEFFNRNLRHRQEIKSVARDLREQEKRAGAPLDLVQLVCSDLVFEITFSGIDVPALATRVAVVVASASEKLLSLFSRFHRADLVRAHPQAAYAALKASIGEGFQRLPTVN